MPPVFGPSSPSRARLKSCAGRRGTTVRAVGDREEGDLGAVEELLDDHPLAGGRVGERLVPVLGDHDALAGGEPVVLHDVRRAERVERLRGLLGARADPGHRGRHVGGGHHLLGERLGALEPGRLGGRAEAGDPGRAHGVGDPGDQRRLRADDDEVHAEVAGQRGDRLPVDGVHVVQRCRPRPCPGLPGAACTAVTFGSRDSARASACSRPPPPMTRTCTAQPSRRVIDCSRPGPTPTPQNGAPETSSSART